MRKVRKSGKLVYGVGVNDAEHTVSVDGKYCIFYKTWNGMLERGYSEPFKLKHPTYADVRVCSEWHLFSNFKAWMELQDYEGKQLDKDLLIRGNKVYGPESCVFVSGLVNKFMTDRALDRGLYPLGVSDVQGSKKFRARCSRLGSGSDYLGVFNTPEEAHAAYKKHKAKLAVELAGIQTDPRISAALLARYVN